VERKCAFALALVAAARAVVRRRAILEEQVWLFACVLHCRDVFRVLAVRACSVRALVFAPQDARAARWRKASARVQKRCSWLRCRQAGGRGKGCDGNAARIFCSRGASLQAGAIYPFRLVNCGISAVPFRGVAAWVVLVVATAVSPYRVARADQRGAAAARALPHTHGSLPVCWRDENLARSQTCRRMVLPLYSWAVANGREDGAYPQRLRVSRRASSGATLPSTFTLAAALAPHLLSGGLLRRTVRAAPRLTCRIFRQANAPRRARLAQRVSSRWSGRMHAGTQT